MLVEQPSTDEQLATDDKLEACSPGHKARCRYCQRCLTLRPWKRLDDATQVYHWVDPEGKRHCMGRVKAGKENALGAPDHRPNVQREL